MKITTEEIDGREEFLTQREYRAAIVAQNVQNWQRAKVAAGERFQRRVFVIVQFGGRFPLPTGERDKLQTLKRKISN